MSSRSLEQWLGATGRGSRPVQHASAPPADGTAPPRTAPRPAPARPPPAAPAAPPAPAPAAPRCSAPRPRSRSSSRRCPATAASAAARTSTASPPASRSGSRPDRSRSRIASGGTPGRPPPSAASPMTPARARVPGRGGCAGPSPRSWTPGNRDPARPRRAPSAAPPGSPTWPAAASPGRPAPRRIRRLPRRGVRPPQLRQDLRDPPLHLQQRAPARLGGVGRERGLDVQPVPPPPAPPPGCARGLEAPHGVRDGLRARGDRPPPDASDRSRLTRRISRFSAWFTRWKKEPYDAQQPTRTRRCRAPRSAPPPCPQRESLLLRRALAQQSELLHPLEHAIARPLPDRLTEQAPSRFTFSESGTGDAGALGLDVQTPPGRPVPLGHVPPRSFSTGSVVSVPLPISPPGPVRVPPRPTSRQSPCRSPRDL